jgi:PTS system ascorbate-specific IIA component
MHCNMAAVLIVAHAPLASALKAVAGHVYADCCHAIEALDVGPGEAPEQVRDRACAMMRRGEPGREDDWLVLTDVFGATPCNAALMLSDALHVRVVSGVNVPMLWRTLCYADESLDALVARAVGGATQGVMQLAPARPQNQASPFSRDPNDHHHQQ